MLALAAGQAPPRRPTLPDTYTVAYSRLVEKVDNNTITMHDGTLARSVKWNAFKSTCLYSMVSVAPLPIPCQTDVAFYIPANDTAITFNWNNLFGFCSRKVKDYEPFNVSGDPLCGQSCLPQAEFKGFVKEPESGRPAELWEWVATDVDWKYTYWFANDTQQRTLIRVREDISDREFNMDTSKDIHVTSLKTDASQSEFSLANSCSRTASKHSAFLLPAAAAVDAGIIPENKVQILKVTHDAHNRLGNMKTKAVSKRRK